MDFEAMVDTNISYRDVVVWILRKLKYEPCRKGVLDIDPAAPELSRMHGCNPNRGIICAKQHSESALVKRITHPIFSQ